MVDAAPAAELTDAVLAGTDGLAVSTLMDASSSQAMTSLPSVDKLAMQPPLHAGT